MNRSYVYRLSPTVDQAAVFDQWAGACRFIYNLALEQRQTWGRAHNIGFARQCREVTQLRKEVDWLGAVPADCLNTSVRALDSAFRRFFKGLARYPRFKRKGDRDAFSFSHPEGLRAERTGTSSCRIRIPKIGWIKARGWRPLGGAIRNATVFRRGAHWYVSIGWSAPMEVVESVLPPVGIDRGVAVLASLSTNTQIVAPPFFASIQERLANAHRVLARRTRGSSNWKKQRDRVRHLTAKATNVRADFLHKTSVAIAKNHGMVVIEKLPVRNMTASGRHKRGLNRAILDKGWSNFARMLDYKLAQRGGSLIEVPPQYTSQTCAECGTVDRESRKSQAEFECTACGHAQNADTNASRNILAAGLAVSARESNRTSGRKREPSQEAVSAAV